MTFAELVKAAGCSTQNFQNALNIPIILYDRKDREMTGTIQFAEPLFTRNHREQSRFIHQLEELENTSSSINQLVVRIDEHSVVLFYKSPKAKIFLREMDY